MFVYLITNRVNGKQYVGQHSGNNLEKYLRRKVCTAKRLIKTTRIVLYQAFCKYGIENFSIRPLVVVGSKWETDRYEIGLIKAFNLRNSEKGYNLTDGGDGTIGVHPNEETRKKISKSHLGIKPSEETRKRLSEVHKGKRLSEQSQLRANESRRGLKRSDETKRKQSEALKGRKLNPEQLLRHHQVHLGVKRSDEARKRIAEAQKNRRIREANQNAVEYQS